jgi:hypothetical protein
MSSRNVSFRGFFCNFKIKTAKKLFDKLARKFLSRTLLDRWVGGWMDLRSILRIANNCKED